MDVGTAIGLFLLALGVGIYGSIIGAGGGFLMVAALVLFFDLSGATAVGTSVVATMFIQLTGAVTYDRKGLTDRGVAKWFVLGSVPVAFTSAAFLTDQIPQRGFDLIVGVLLLALAAFVIFVPTPHVADGIPLTPRRTQLVGAGSVIGLLSGALGVGAGLVTVPLVSGLQRLSAHRAAATTTLIGAISGIAGSIGHSVAGNPKWSSLPFLIAGAVIGGRTGAMSAGRLSQRMVLVLLAGGLVFAGVPLLWRAI